MDYNVYVWGCYEPQHRKPTMILATSKCSTNSPVFPLFFLQHLTGITKNFLFERWLHLRVLYSSIDSTLYECSAVNWKWVIGDLTQKTVSLSPSLPLSLCFPTAISEQFSSVRSSHAVFLPQSQLTCKWIHHTE